MICYMPYFGPFDFDHSWPPVGHHWSSTVGEKIIFDALFEISIKFRSKWYVTCPISSILIILTTLDRRLVIIGHNVLLFSGSIFFRSTYFVLALTMIVYVLKVYFSFLLISSENKGYFFGQFYDFIFFNIKNEPLSNKDIIFHFWPFVLDSCRIRVGQFWKFVFLRLLQIRCQAYNRWSIASN